MGETKHSVEIRAWTPVVALSSARPLDLFPAAVAEGEIIVDTSTVVSRSSFEDTQVAS